MTSTRPVPNLNAPIGIARGAKVHLLEPWVQFFQQFVQNAPTVVNATVGTSPFSYTPNQNGTVIVSGGTVSLIQLIRGAISITIATSTTDPSVIPVSIGDTVKVTYTVLPTMQFLGA